MVGVDMRAACSGIIYGLSIDCAKAAPKIPWFILVVNCKIDGFEENAAAQCKGSVWEDRQNNCSDVFAESFKLLTLNYEVLCLT